MCTTLSLLLWQGVQPHPYFYSPQEGITKLTGKFAKSLWTFLFAVSVVIDSYS